MLLTSPGLSRGPPRAPFPGAGITEPRRCRGCFKERSPFFSFGREGLRGPQRSGPGERGDRPAQRGGGAAATSDQPVSQCPRRSQHILARPGLPRGLPENRGARKVQPPAGARLPSLTSFLRLPRSTKRCGHEELRGKLAATCGRASRGLTAAGGAGLPAKGAWYGRGSLEPKHSPSTPARRLLRRPQAALFREDWRRMPSSWAESLASHPPKTRRGKAFPGWFYLLVVSSLEPRRIAAELSFLKWTTRLLNNLKKRSKRKVNQKSNMQTKTNKTPPGAKQIKLKQSEGTPQSPTSE
ncbi:uncharacterized protein LOC132709656 [Pantherophis guttatus]|uniref:Uncharacterized protein LOC132709656 n=1 Tax=Pantherophis guttatus TaxID=94885 RepID=A0ABM3YUQ3_PANGU|nr:uncharacterized protein LOC132709656 [Pantherophis guttatus]